MCECETNSNIHLKVIAAKDKIRDLFFEHGIIAPVTIENVEKALEEESENGDEFEKKLSSILASVNLKNNAGTDKANKNDVAMGWVNTLFGSGSQLANGIISAKNPTPVNNYYQTPTTSSGDSSKTIMYVMIAVIVVVVLGVVLMLLKK